MTKKILNAGAVLIMIFLLGNIIGIKAQTDGIADKLVRFHIVADSDSIGAQNVKWEVRKKIFERLKMPEFKSKEEALSYFKSEKENIEKTAEETLLKNGCNYGCKVYIGKKYFPVRKYKTFTLPSGIYDTVSIALGSAEGRNFFCIMYPSVCAVSSISEETDESPSLLGSVLTDSEVDAVSKTGGKTVVKFKIAEIFGKIMSN